MVRKLLRYTGRRYLIGMFGPLVLNSILLYLIVDFFGSFAIDQHSNILELLLYASNNPFLVFMPTVFIIVFMIIGIQSIAYSFIMERLILRYIKNRYVVIFLSTLLCLLFPFCSLISLSKPDEPFYAVDISFYLASGMTGIILGYTLHHIYSKDIRYAQWLLIKKNLDRKGYYRSKLIKNIKIK